MRKLATNCHIENFNYGTRYTFQTVHHKSTYSYCICKCGFENEFVNYIAEDGSIDEDVFEKIVQSMIDGKCPHVTSNVTKDWIRTTGVSAAHIAVAAGTKLKIGAVVQLEFMSDLKLKGQKIFNLELYAIAFLKKKFNIVGYYYKIYMEYFKLGTDNSVVLYSKKLENKPDSVVIRVVPRMIAFIQTGDQELLEYLLKPKHYKWGTIALESSHIEEALHYAWRNNLTDTYKTLLTSENLVDYPGYRTYIVKHLTALIMYDQADALADFLYYKPPEKFQFLRNPCYVLDRPKCKEVLSKYQTPDETKHLTDKAKTELLIRLLDSFFEDFKDEIITTLKKIPNYRDECKEWLLTDCEARLKPDVLETLLALTLSMGDDKENELFIEKLIRELLHYGSLFHNSWTREKLKLLFKLNTSTEYLKDVVTTLVGWDDVLDKSIMIKFSSGSQHFEQENFEEVYQLDAKEHGMFGYDGDSFALNFARPFLLESGVTIPRGNLELNVLDDKRHSTECAYIVNYLESLYDPVPLAILCRDRIRQHFRGLRLHKYLEMTVCSNKIKDFILMGYSLWPNSRVLYKMNHVGRTPVFGHSDHKIWYALEGRPGINYD